MADAFKVGDRVKLRHDVYEHADDHAPGDCLARAGEVLMVRHVALGVHWQYRVSHNEITNNSFGVNADEIEDAK